MPIELPQEPRQQSIASIRRYFAEKLDEDIGDLKAGLLLDFFLDEIGPLVHNRAIEVAQAYFQERVTDLDNLFHEVGFGYWT